MTGIVVYF